MVFPLNYRLLLVLSILNSIIGSAIVFMFVITPVWQIVFSIMFFSLTLLLQLLLFNFRLNAKIRLSQKSTVLSSVLIFAVALFATIIIIVIPVSPKITDSSILTIFISLPPLAFTKVVFGYFILCFFPGYILLRSLMDIREFNCFEQLGLSLALSFGVSDVIGLVLLKMSVEINLYSMLLSIWIFVLVLTSYRFIIKRDTTVATAKSTAKGSKSFLSYLLLFSICLILIISFYVNVLSASTYTGVFNSDIPRNFNALNEFMFSTVHPRIAYPSWVSFNAWIIHSVVNLPPLYAYAGFQFYIIMVPISVYFLCKTIFQQHKDSAAIAAIASALVSIFAGFESIGILTANLNNYHANPYSVLDILQQNIGLKSLVVFHINGYTVVQAATFEGILCILALAFAYRYLKTKKMSELLFCSFLSTVSIFSHNLELFLIFGITIIAFSIFTKGYMALFKIIVLTFFVFFVFDYLSNNYFQNLIEAVYMTWFLGPYKILISPNNVLTITIAFICAIITLIAAVKFRFKIKQFSRLLLNAVNSKSQRWFLIFLWALSITILILSLVLWTTNYASITLNSTSSPYPWYYQVIFYGVIFLFSIGTLTLVLKKITKLALIFIFSWFSSILLAIVLGILAPNILTPEIWTLRFASFLGYPMAFFASFGILTGFKLIKSKKKLVLTCLSLFLLIIILVPAFLSYSYNTEFWYNSGLGPATTTHTAALDWMYNNLPSNACVLTISDSSYRDVVNLAGKRAIPLYPFYSWPQLTLSNSELPEDVLNMLNKLNVTYVYVTDTDMKSADFQTLFSLLNCFQLVHETKDAKIFEVPKYPLYTDSSYILVDSLFDNKSANHLNAFEMLYYDGFKFSIKNDIDVTYLLPNNVYFFSSNQQVPSKLLNILIPGVEGGANVVFMDSSFASTDELGDAAKFDSVLLNKIHSVSSSYVNADAVILNNGSKLSINGNTIIHPVNMDESEINILSYFSLSNGSLVPFVAQQRLGNGSVTFFNMPFSQNLNDTLPILSDALSDLIETLPHPNTPNKTLEMPYPSQLYEFTIPWESNLYNLKDLYGSLLSDSDVVFSGHQEFQSTLAMFKENNLNVENISITDEDGKTQFITDVKINNITISGNAVVFSKNAQISLFNPPSVFSIFTTGGVEKSLIFTNANMDLTFSSHSQTMQINSKDANITINSEDPLSLIMYKPTVTINGTAELACEGGFSETNGFFYAMPAAQNQFVTYVPIVLNGSFTMQMAYSSGLLMAKLDNTTNIHASFLQEVMQTW